MELRVLRYFLAVAEKGSVTGAAKVLHVTQPTLSRQLMDLEEELGQKLLVRSNHSVRLTSEGMLLRNRAREILEMVQKTESEFNSMGKNIAGNVYIGCGESEAMMLIAKVMKEINLEFPEIRFQVYSGNAEDVTERLDKGILDFGVLIQPVDISRYDYLSLPAKDRWGVIVPEDSPLAEKRFVTREELLGVPLICSRQVSFRSLSGNPYTDWFGEDGKLLNIVATYNLIYNAILMVKAGLGYAVGLDKLLAGTSVNGVCFRPFFPELESELNIVWKKSPLFSKAAELFFQRIQVHFGTNEQQ